MTEPTAGNVLESIDKALVASGTKPLTLHQRAIVLGSLAVWLEKARDDGARTALKRTPRKVGCP